MLNERTIELLLRDRVRFGIGSIGSLPGLVRELGGPNARAFIVSDPGVVASGVTTAVGAILSQAGVDHDLFGGVEPNPGTSVVERGGCPGARPRDARPVAPRDGAGRRAAPGARLLSRDAGP